jgi:uncharacterized membrane protein YfcA
MVLERRDAYRDPPAWNAEAPGVDGQTANVCAARTRICVVTLEPLQYGLGALSGIFIGFSLGMIGGGGSVLAVPLMVYFVGVKDPHIAIGTSAFAVAVNAASSLFNHAAAGTVKWRCGGMYAAAGIIGASSGSTAGKAFNGQKLLFLFALVMVLIGILMLRGRKNFGEPGVECTHEKAPKVFGYGFVTGIFSGFFGIGGGFLIVPGLIGSTGMPILNAIGTSLVAVTVFGFTTAINYAISGLVDWPLAAVLIAGGMIGGFIGIHAAKRLARKTGHLPAVFSALVFVVAAYMIYRTLPALMPS